MKNKSVLVTGGNGFIGSNIVKQLSCYNNVTVLDVDTNNKHNNTVNVNSNMMDYDFSKEEFDYIFHQAAIVDTRYDNDDIYNINAEFIKKLIKVCERTDGKLIYASSCAVYGNTDIPNTVNKSEEPLNKYGKSKLLQDNIVREYISSNETRVPVVGLRYSNVYGDGENHKGDMASMIYQINSKIVKNQPIRLFKYGEQKRDFVYIKDIVNYNIYAADKDISGIYNAGYGDSYSFNDVIRFFELYYNRSFNIDWIDNPYPFFQNHTLTSLNRDLYKPIYDLKTGIFDYLNVIRL
jgi:ADP-L-glycero-D-manno-heptose 6-epimerase